MPSQRYVKHLSTKYGQNAIEYLPPIVIDRHNVDSPQFRPLWLFTNDNIWVVFEGRTTESDAPSPKNPSNPMDEERQKERSIGRIEAIVSPRLGNFKAYKTVDAEEVHGEFWACDVLVKIRESNLQLFLYPNNNNYRSAHTIVTNIQSSLLPFFGHQQFNYEHIASIILKNSSKSSGGKERINAHSAHFGLKCR